MIPNMNYQNLKESYLFYNIAQKTKAYLEAHPGAHLYRMGIWRRFSAALRCRYPKTS